MLKRNWGYPIPSEVQYACTSILDGQNGSEWDQNIGPISAGQENNSALDQPGETLRGNRADRSGEGDNEGDRE